VKFVARSVEDRAMWVDNLNKVAADSERAALKEQSILTEELRETGVGELTLTEISEHLSSENGLLSQTL